MLALTFCYGQMMRVEHKLMDCWYQSFGDKREDAIEMVKIHELYLIEKGVIEDNTAKSYRAFYEMIAKGEDNYKVPRSFYIAIENMGSSWENYYECKKAVAKNTIYSDTSNLTKYDSVWKSILKKNTYTRADIAKGILSVLDEDDFGLDYYKIRAFIMQDLIIVSERWNLELPKKHKYTNQKELDAALKIDVDKNLNYFVQNEIKSFNGLKEIVKEY